MGVRNKKFKINGKASRISICFPIIQLLAPVKQDFMANKNLSGVSIFLFSLAITYVIVFHDQHFFTNARGCKIVSSGKLLGTHIRFIHYVRVPQENKCRHEPLYEITRNNGTLIYQQQYYFTEFDLFCLRTFHNGRWGQFSITSLSLYSKITKFATEKKLGDQQ